MGARDKSGERQIAILIPPDATDAEVQFVKLLHDVGSRVQAGMREVAYPCGQGHRQGLVVQVHVSAKPDGPNVAVSHAFYCEGMQPPLIAESEGGHDGDAN